MREVMKMMKPELVELAKQINAKELHFAKFKLVYDNDKNTITLFKGQKYMTITYKRHPDTYDVRRIKIKGCANITYDETLTDVYDDMLRGLIQDWFKFEYVMDGLMIHLKGGDD